MTRTTSGSGSGSGPGGEPPGLDAAMAVMAVAAVIGGTEQLGLWPAALDGAAGTIVPATVMVVLAVWRVAGRVGRAATGVWAGLRGTWRADPAGTGDPDGGLDADEAVAESEANAAVLAVHLPDPTLFPPAAANDDEKDKPSVM